MKAIRLRQPAGLDNLKLEDMATPGDPGPGEIRVRLRASSLNYHDYLVAVGGIPTPDGRIPMSDGAGEVLALGTGVSEFAVGQKVVSTFFPNWLDGRPVPGGFSAVPGDGTTRQMLDGAPYAPAASFDVVEAAVRAARATRTDADAAERVLDLAQQAARAAEARERAAAL